MSTDDPRKAPNRKGDVELAERPKLDKARKWAVIFHNDDYTTREFVVLVLMQFFQKSETEATHIMLSVHYKGRGIAGVFSKDIAETKVDQVHQFSESNGFPLRLSAEPAE